MGEMIKGEGDGVMDWIWRLCNMAFESDVIHSTRVKERGLDVRIIELLAC